MGSLTALDLAPENIAMVEACLVPDALPCPLGARLGSVLEVPFHDAHFNAISCANVMQDLADEALLIAPSELRVSADARPG